MAQSKKEMIFNMAFDWLYFQRYIFEREEMQQPKKSVAMDISNSLIKRLQ